MKHVSSLAKDFCSDPIAGTDYRNFMDKLLHIVAGKLICNDLGDQIQNYALEFVRNHSFNTFNQFSPNSYIRNYLGRDPKDHWEALVMSWQKGNRTAIHAHPQFAGYTFADGEFLIEIFEPVPEGIRLQYQTIIKDIEGFYAIGAPGQFDNHIHRITCLSATGHSLHIYSDDALKGLKIPETQVISKS